MLNAPNTPLLNIFERLAALSEDEGGLVKVKPFRDWKGSSWQKKILKMRLLNVGEMLEVYDYCEKYQGTAKDQAYYGEVVIRSLYSIGDIMLAPADEVDKYNKEYNTHLSRVEYLRNWVQNLEQLVLQRLFSIYEQLQLKQLRLVNKQYMDDITGEVYDVLLPTARKIKYSIGEIVVPVENMDLSLYDFEDEIEEEASFAPPPTTSTAAVVQDFAYYCTCDKGFNEFEEFTIHRETCEKAAQV